MPDTLKRMGFFTSTTTPALGTSNGTLYTAPLGTAWSVTFQDTGDTVTLNSHGIIAGTRVYFSSITSTTGISTSTWYYVVNPTANTFQLATSPGGAAIALTTNGSGTMYYGATAVIRSIHVCNTTTSSATLTLALNGTSATATNCFIKAFGVPANGLLVENLNIVMESGDTIQALQGTAAALTLIISGVEF